MKSEIRKAFVAWGDQSIKGGGGAERRFARLFQYMRDYGEKVFFIMNKEMFDALRATKIVVSDQGIVIYPHKSSKNTVIEGIRYSQWLIHILKELKISLIHLPLIQRKLLPFYLYLNVNNNLVVVSTVAHSKFGSGESFALSLSLTAKLLWKRADVIDSLYERFKSSFAAVYPDKIFVSPNSFTDHEIFKPSPAKENWVVFAGRLIPEKQPILFVDAISILVRRNPSVIKQWKFWILGKGPLENMIKKRIHEHRLKGIVVCHSTSDIATMLSQSSIFVSLQRLENYPSQSLLEAMACENAIVVTDVGETRKLISPDTGVLLEKQMPEELAKALEYLILNKKTCLSFGSKAHNTIITNYTIDRFASYIQRIWGIAYTKRHGMK